jgi:uncharacterized tellurite resistance protein B-like protein
MENIAYQKVLFKTVMCVMACDGEIHESEIKEVELAFQQTEYFKDLVFKDELALVINEFNQNEKKFVWDCISSFSEHSLSPVQELQVLELILRIIYADGRVDRNELEFLKIVKSHLNVSNEIFFKRFGDVDGLGANHTIEKITAKTQYFISELNLPELGELELVKLNE